MVPMYVVHESHHWPPSEVGTNVTCVYLIRKCVLGHQSLVFFFFFLLPACFAFFVSYSTSSISLELPLRI